MKDSPKEITIDGVIYRRVVEEKEKPTPLNESFTFGGDWNPAFVAKTLPEHLTDFYVEKRLALHACNSDGEVIPNSYRYLSAAKIDEFIAWLNLMKEDFNL